ncbi:MAG: DUF2079 domain-containing protein [Myxococcota bacterium]|nr:DUF2079 domain-containing protein [Myxococcota bacterium]
MTLERFQKPLLLLMMATAWVIWGLEQEAAFASHQSMWSQDLAFFHQILFHASQGDAWTSPILLEPTGFFSMVHFHPILALILPIYMLAPSASTLLWINAGAVAATAWPLAKIGEKATGSLLFGLAAGAAWLVWLPARSAAIADFRPMVFLIPALAWVVWGVFAQRRAAWIAGALLCCAAREESAYLLPSIGLLLAMGLPLGGKRRSEGLWILGIGVFWLGFLLLFKDNFFFHFNPINLLSGEGGPSPSGELTGDRLEFWGQSLAGGYAAAVLQPAALLFGAGPLHWLMTDAQREWHAVFGTVVYLKNPMLPLIASAGTLGAAWVIRKKEKALPAVCVLLVLGNLLGFRAERNQFNQRRSDNRAMQNEGEVPALQTLIDAVDSEARVVTDYRLIALLSGREVLWNRAHLYLADSDKPPHWKETWPLSFEVADTVLLPEDDPLTVHLDDDWTSAQQAGGYGLWIRKAKGAGVDPAPLTH